MTAPASFMRRSFVYRRLLAAGCRFGTLADAALATTRPAEGSEDALKLVDLSVCLRWGVKGRGALPWLTARGAVLPAADHRSVRQADGTLVARLSPGEALVLGPVPVAPSGLGAAIERIPAEGEAGCYPVPRRDSHAWFMIVGEDAARMFAKLCGVDLSPGSFAEGQVAQTSVARLSAIVIRNDVIRNDSIRKDLGPRLAFSILADSASAEYLWDCLLDAMAEFHGAVVGADGLAAGEPPG
jgi:sarcosine oxidase subunit gamma